MKSPLCQSLFILLGIALSAHAEVINVTATRTAFDSNLDQVILRVQSITGTDVPENTPISELIGSWTMGSGAMNLPGPSPGWSEDLLNDSNEQDSDGGLAGVGPKTPQSWFNFSVRTGDPPSRNGLVSGTLYNGFTEGLAVSGLAFAVEPVDLTPDNGFDNTLLAVLYVSNTSTFSQGQTIFSGTGIYYTMPEWNNPTTVQIVPEPSSLILLGLAAFTACAVFLRRRLVGK
jgi:hypothetical protein